MRRRTNTLFTTTAAALLATAVIAAPHAAAQSPALANCPLPHYGPGADYHPHIDPAGFSARVTNPLFPLVVGRTLVYAGSKDGKSAVDLFVASPRTAVIDGVRTRVVEDRLFLDGVLEERTSDYYAQDRCGNVWYFGEDTAVLDERGHVVDTSGSFHAGVDGAEPGVFMQASPSSAASSGRSGTPGEAEDTYRAVATGESVRVPYGEFHDALRTVETTALEPGVVDNKLYVAGIGEVIEKAVRGPVEKLALVDVLP